MSFCTKKGFHALLKSLVQISRKGNVLQYKLLECLAMSETYINFLHGVNHKFFHLVFMTFQACSFCLYFNIRNYCAPSTYKQKKIFRIEAFMDVLQKDRENMSANKKFVCPARLRKPENLKKLSQIFIQK